MDIDSIGYAHINEEHPALDVNFYSSWQRGCEDREIDKEMRHFSSSDFTGARLLADVLLLLSVVCCDHEITEIFCIQPFTAGACNCYSSTSDLCCSCFSTCWIPTCHTVAEGDPVVLAQDLEGLYNKLSKGIGRALEELDGIHQLLDSNVAVHEDAVAKLSERQSTIAAYLSRMSLERDQIVRLRNGQL